MSDTPRETQDTAKPTDQNNTTPADSTNGTVNASAAAEGGKPETTESDLETKLTEAQSKANEYLDGWQRARADFANYKKRAEKERDEAYQNAAVDTLKKILPIVDDFDRAVSNVPGEKADDDVIKGFTLIHRKFLNLLDNAQIKVINPQGEAFNPAFHEAIGQDESSDVPSGHISSVLQKGYMYGDKVLRPAMVRVAS
jgi:molecular chaperone GrpE